VELGQKVIVRSSPSGCWYGTLEAQTGDVVTLSGARRLWRWWAGEGVSLSGVASAGLKESKLSECRIAPAVAAAEIFSVCEILSTTDRAQASIEAAPVYAQ
jgi:hypothetical protein